MKFLILNQKSAHKISVYDLQTGAEIFAITTPLFPHEFCINTSKTHIFIGHYGVLGSDVIGDNGGCSVFVLDIFARKIIHTLSAWPHYRIHGVAMDERDRLYALSENSGALLRFTDPKNQIAPDLAVPTGGYKSHLFSLSHDGNLAYVVNLLSNTVTKISPNDPTVPPKILHSGGKPEGNCLSPDEKTLFVTHRRDDTLVAIDTATMKILRETKTATDPNRVYFHDGALFVTNYGEKFVTKFSLSLEKISEIPVQAAPIAMSFFGTHGFLSLANDTVAIINLAQNSIEKIIKTRSEPDVSCVVEKI